MVKPELPITVSHMTSHPWQPADSGCSALRLSTMSLRDATDQLNMSSWTASAVRRRYPAEAQLFSTAATILETNTSVPTGWSLLRLLQQRGNVVITSDRVFIRSGFVSVLNLVWICVVTFSVNKVFNGAGLPHVLLSVVGAIFIFQRRPYLRNIPFTEIHSVQFGAVQGVAARCDIMSIDVGTHAIQLVTSQVIPDNVRLMLQQF